MLAQQALSLSHLLSPLLGYHLSEHNFIFETRRLASGTSKLAWCSMIVWWWSSPRKYVITTICPRYTEFYLACQYLFYIWCVSGNHPEHDEGNSCQGGTVSHSFHLFIMNNCSYNNHICSYNKHLVLPSTMQEALRDTTMKWTQGCCHAMCCLSGKPGIAGEAVPDHPL